MRASRFTKMLLKALHIDANTIATVPLTVQAVTGQTANIAEFQNSAGTVVTAIDSAGRLSGQVSNLSDTAGVVRLVPNPTAKTIVDGSATSLFDVAVAAGGLSGGVIFYHVQVGDGTDLQSLVGMVTYSVVNKAATLTLTITEVSGNQAKAVSSGTLTLAWTFVTGTLKGTVKLQPTGSLTETTPYTVSYTVLPITGAITIL